MEYPISNDNWLPVLLADVTQTPIPGVTWNTAGLVVTYKAPGAVAAALTTSAENWRESLDGVYEVKFTAAQSGATVGTFLYSIAFTDAMIYAGAVQLVDPSAGSPIPLPGSVEWAYTVTLDGDPCQGAAVLFYSDEERSAFVQGGISDELGLVTLHVPPAHYYITVYAPTHAVAYDEEDVC
jgi:hypothetical protein